MSEYGGEDATAYRFILVAPRALVKRVKTILEQHQKADSCRKIKLTSEAEFGYEGLGGKYSIATTFASQDEADQFLATEDLADVRVMKERYIIEEEKTHASALGPLLQNWLDNLCLPDINELAIQNEFPKTWSLYGSFLMFPQNAFQSALWNDTFRKIGPTRKQDLFERLAKHLKVSHIAINAPIPPENVQGHDGTTGKDNILRSPSNLTPLYGDFGPICTSQTPSKADFDLAFWCRAKQNGITQVWAPSYTMFSRGNITEKARVLRLPTVASAVAEHPDTGCSAVDLYSGIGYFSFSYIAAGVRKVLCWDLNPWSIEGLRRGAVANKWGVDVHQTYAKTEDVPLTEMTRLIAFVESNEHALARIETLRNSLPPIRHVNCGLLPTSRGSYYTAAAALDPKFGGWVHVHENFALAEIDLKAEEVRRIFHQTVQDLDRVRGLLTSEDGRDRMVTVDHVQRVKSYAPGVFHCVVDLFIPPCHTDH